MDNKNTITASDIVNEIIIRYPETVAIFNAFRIDSCCGGGVTLEKSARRDKVDLEKLLGALNKKVKKRAK